jgi:hypothetical protein
MLILADWGADCFLLLTRPAVILLKMQISEGQAIQMKSIEGAVNYNKVSENRLKQNNHNTTKEIKQNCSLYM